MSTLSHINPFRYLIIKYIILTVVNNNEELWLVKPT
jgi:hypothetical protein